MDRTRWLDTSATVLVTLLDLLSPQERDAAFEELVAKVRAKRAKSRSAVLEPVKKPTPARGHSSAFVQPDRKIDLDPKPVAAVRPRIPREEPK